MELDGTGGHQIGEKLQTPRMIIGQSRNKVEQTGRAGSFLRKRLTVISSNGRNFSELLEIRIKFGFRDFQHFFGIHFVYNS